jgi:hypothetical protein
MTAVISFDIAAFRELYPAFANETTYPNTLLENNWSIAILYISDQDYGWVQGNARAQALNMMTAHLTALGDLIASGETLSIPVSASVGDVSVNLLAPPAKNQWQWWLNLTPYGAQLLALLTALSRGGIYVGGAPERAAFRKVGGVF